MSRSCAAILLLLCFATGALGAPRESSFVVAHGSPPKPSGPIDVVYRLAAVPRVGQPIDVEITARGAAVDELRIEANVSADAALVLVALTPAPEVADRKAWIVTVLPLAPGTAYLTVVVTSTEEALEQSRSVVVPIRVPLGSRRVGQEAVTTPGGERLILLPVEERSAQR